jgi:hypothetical protein
MPSPGRLRCGPATRKNPIILGRLSGLLTIPPCLPACTDLAGPAADWQGGRLFLYAALADPDLVSTNPCNMNVPWTMGRPAPPARMEGQRVFQKSTRQDTALPHSTAARHAMQPWLFENEPKEAKLKREPGQELASHEPPRRISRSLTSRIKASGSLWSSSGPL